MNDVTPAEWRRIAREALAPFGLADERATTLRRQRNAVFRVAAKDGQRFVLRVRSLERFDDPAARAQLAWLEHLSMQIPDGVPEPLRTTGGRRFAHVDVDGERWRVTCFTWVDGRAARGHASVKPARLRAIGHVVAQLHAHSVGRRPAGFKACPRLDADHLFGAKTAAGGVGRVYLTPAQHGLVRRAAARIRRAMRRTQESAQHVGLIHGDLEPSNWVFHRGMPRPIDFDEFGVGPFAFDLLQVLWTYAIWPDYPRHRAELLAGYESIRSISDADRRELDLYQAIPFIAWLHRCGSADDEAARERFQKWLAPTLRRIGELCEVSA